MAKLMFLPPQAAYGLGSADVLSLPQQVTYVLDSAPQGGRAECPVERFLSPGESLLLSVQSFHIIGQNVTGSH